MHPPDEPAPWQVLSKRLIYASEWGINMALWSVRLPDGKVVRDHPVLDHLRPAVTIIPVGADGRILMIDHYRVITDRRGWELPAGRVDAGESVDEAAHRELLEETGHSAEAWTTLGAYHPSNGSSNQVFYVQVARQLTRQSGPTDRNETMALRWFDIQEIRQLVRANEIYDGLTLTGLCWAITLGVIGTAG
jgi:8-oxo-dGTP pyrophosphatase MutT (NUDIX family)